MKTVIDNLEFEPLVRFMTCGNEIQRCVTKVEGVGIMWQTYFPWNIFEDPIDIFYVDLIFPMSTPIENGRMSDNGYFEEGFGWPVFLTLENAVIFIENYKLKINV